MDVQIVEPNTGKMRKGSRKKRRATKRQAEAGAANLKAFLGATATPPALRSGVRSASVRAGKLPEGYGDLQALLDGFYDGWIADLGGEENLTNAKRALLWVSRGCLAIFALGLEQIKANGLINPDGDVQPVAKVLATYGNSMRLNLAAAGLERVPRNVTKTLEEYLASKTAASEEITIAPESTQPEEITHP
jgi:hypothetical protein